MERDRKSSDEPTDLWAPYFEKRGKNMQWRKYSLFNECCWENRTAACKRMKLEHFLTPYTKINSKWIRDLNVRPETIKLLEENTGSTLLDKHYSKILFDSLPGVRKKKTKMNTWDLMKLKSFFAAKETINNIKREPSESEKNNCKWKN